MNFTQIMTAQAQVITNHLVIQGNVGYRPQPNVSTSSPRILDFMRMNSPNYHGTKVGEDP